MNPSRSVTAGISPSIAATAGHVVGHQVVVGHRHERVVDADHPADPPGPQTARVDDVVALDRALLGLDAPRAGRQAFEPEHPVVLDEVGAALP